MTILKMTSRKTIYIGYILVGIAINGFFGIFLVQNDPGTPRWAWYLLAIIGSGILSFKTLRFSKNNRLKVVTADIVFMLILISFAMVPIPLGINFVIGSVLAVLFLYFFIDQKILKNIIGK